jgi:hypothetical protein
VAENDDNPIDETVDAPDGGTDEGQEPEWTPPTKQEWEAFQAKYKKANASDAARRKRIEELEKKGESETDAKVREAVEQATKSERDGADRIAIGKGLKAALAEAGYTGSQDVARRLIDTDALEVDDDGEVNGLDEQIRALKKELPEKFRRNGSSSVDGGDRVNRGGKYSADQLETLRMLKEAGYAA